MSRVLVTGGAGAIGGAIVRRLLADPAYEVRVSDRRLAPQWMREGAEVHEGDLRVAREARAALDGCTHVIHLGGLDDDAHDAEARPFTLMEAESAVCSTMVGAAVAPGAEVERFVYVSSAAVFERASEFPTSEAYLAECPTPESPYGFAMLAGEMYCRAADEEHGLQYTICRLFDAYGPTIGPSATPDVPCARKRAPESASALNDLIMSVLAGETTPRVEGAEEHTRTPTHMDDIASGVIASMGTPKAVNEDFNIAAARELTVAEIVRIVWETCGEDPESLATEPLLTATGPLPMATGPLPTDTVEARRSWPSVEKARRLLGWEARIEAEEGIAATVEWIRARGSVGSAP
ncbi:MAG TPA: NAD(P)-dependent oxidoreductase [Solirubrobacteraceae bacterium]|jgi:nucleoside-diphosphate-sugar epimerase